MLSLAPVALAAALAHTGVQALPSGAQVVSGQLSQSTPAAGQLLLNQGSARAIVDWKSFGIAAGESVRLAQPGGGLALFRVTGPEPSRILGALSASGSLFLLNPSGVYFGAGAQVDVGSLTASTLGLGNDDFLNGRYRFAGASGAAVENQGTISAARGGHIVLLGREVINGGTLQATGGTVALGAAGAATLDLYGNGLLKLTLTEGSDGAGVSQSGRVLADGGVASLQALGASAFVNVSGLARASSLVERGGEIYLSAGPQGAVSLTGTLDASATSGGDGGRIEVAGERITLGAGSRLLADAGAQGHGGTVNAIATGDMRFEGRLSARGGSLGGDGGEAEVSGHASLSFTGDSDLRAPAGRTGTLLLDPGSISIIDSAGNEAGPNVFGDAQVASLLGRNSLTLSTANADNDQPRIITVAGNADITWSAATTLTLRADRAVVLEAGAVLRNTSFLGAQDFNAVVLRGNPGAVATGTPSTGVTLRPGAIVEAQRGSIVIEGRGGNSGVGQDINHGVHLMDGARVSSVNGSIAITGSNGERSGVNSHGIYLEGSATVRTAGAGGIELTGEASGQVQGSAGAGVAFGNGSPVVQAGSGDVVITGTTRVPGAAQTIHSIDASPTISSAQGNVTLIAPMGRLEPGIRFSGGAPVIGSAQSTGDIRIVANSVSLDNVSLRTRGTLSFETVEVFRPVSIGGNDGGQLSLTPGELSGIGVGTLRLGSSGRFSVVEAFSPGNGAAGRIELVSSADVQIDAPIDAGTARLRVSGSSLLLTAPVTSTATDTAAARAVELRSQRQFVNAAGAQAISTPNGHWLVAADSPFGGLGGLMSGNPALWNRAADAAVPEPGNRYAFAVPPTVYVDGGRTTKPYGDAPAVLSTPLDAAPVEAVSPSYAGEYTDLLGATFSGTFTRTSAGLAGSSARGFYLLLAADVSQLTSSLAGYRFAIGRPGLLEVVPRPLELRPDPVSRVFGDSGPDTGTARIVGGSLVNGDRIDARVSLSGEGASAAVGRYPLRVTGVTFLQGDPANYEISGADLQGLTITPRPVTLAPRAVRRAFDDPNPTRGPADVVGGSLAAFDRLGSVALSSPATRADAIGTTFDLFASDASFASGRASNYDIRYQPLPGGLTIGRQVLTVLPDAVTRAYGEANPATGGFSLTSGRLLAGDSLTGPLTLATPATPASVPGRYSLSGSGAVLTAANPAIYEVVYTPRAAGLTVGPRPDPLTIQGLGTVTRAYGDDRERNQLRGGELVGGSLLPGDRLVSVRFDPSALTPSTPVGSYPLPISEVSIVNGAGADVSAGYTYNLRPATYRITPLPITVIPLDQTRVYGDPNPVVVPAVAQRAGALDLPNGDTLSGVVLSTAATLASPVGRYSGIGTEALFSVGSATNYDITFRENPRALRITQRPLVITPLPLSRPYGDANPTTGAVSGDLANGDTLASVSLISPAVATSPVGRYSLRASDAVFGSGNAANYSISYATLPQGLTVAPRPLVLTPAELTRTYGDANPAAAGFRADGLVNGDGVASLGYTTAATAASDAGIYATRAANPVWAAGSPANYQVTLAENPTGLTVTARPATVTVGALTRRYGDANPAGVPFTADNLVNGDRIAGVDVETAATVASDVGRYALRAANARFDAGKASNYQLRYVDDPVGLTVTPRPLQVTAQTVSRPYGAANPARAPAAGDALVNGDTLASVSLATAADAASPVGRYATRAGDALFATGRAANYLLSYADNAEGLAITPAPLTLTPAAVTRLYGDANPARVAALADGLVGGDRIADLALLSDAGAAAGVGRYATGGAQARFASGSADNYAISYARNDGGLTITPRPLTITPDALSRAYGDANPATAGASGDNLVNGDRIASVALATSATVASSVGVYETKADSALFASGLASNYLIGYAPNASGLSITPRPLTITPDALSRTYGDGNPARGSASGDNLVNGDRIASVALATSATVASHVGRYETRAADAVFASGQDGNYLIRYAPNAGGLSITPRALTVTPDAVSRTYGDANPATAGASGNNLVNGDTLAGVSISSPATAASDVGRYPTDAADARFASGQASDYTIDYARNPGGMNVTPRPVTLAPRPVERFYGDANPATGDGVAVLGTIVNGDRVARVTLRSPASATSPVGRYPLDAGEAVFDIGKASNYAIGYDTAIGGLAVEPRPLTVTPDAVSRRYGDANPGSGLATVTAGRLVNGDTLGSLSLASPADALSGVGSYRLDGTDLRFATGAAGNYAVSIAPRADGLAVTPRALTITPDAVSRPYGDANPASGTARGDNLVNGDRIASVSLGTPATEASNVGLYETQAGSAVFASGLASNYAITYAANAGGLSITPRPLTVTPDAVSRIYGDANPARGTARGDNLVNGDRIASVALSTPAAVASSVGTYETQAADAVFGSGLASNYAIRYAPNASGLAITPRPIGVAPVAGQGKPAGAPDPLLRAEVVAGQLVGGDGLSGSLQRSPGEVPGSYLIEQGSLGAGGNYTLAYSPGRFTILPTVPGFVVEPVTPPATALLASLSFAGLPPTAAGTPPAAAGAPPAAAGAPREVDLACVREQALPGTDPARLVNRGMRLPAGVADPCR